MTERTAPAAQSHQPDKVAAKGHLRILQLYPRDMNIYGDWGNVLSLSRRAQKHGYTTEIIDYNPEDEFPEDVDIVIGGGGQDSGQSVIQEDLHAVAPRLRRMAENGVPMLVICGLYQLFGHEFTTVDGQVLEGIGIFDARTVGGRQRLIGNIVLDTPEFGQVVGYENHSGLTYLGQDVQPLGTVTLGQGNNLDDAGEGARVHHVIGSYLHGSLLPKNPRITDYLIGQAARRRCGSFDPEPIDDTLAERAREVAASRPR
ncbi:type 1 glutamine amidotransferase [Rothia kristinae]|uniref:type 1 glutamine amidotransferase n=1 Tax=Rothia kristinae TaxID=37923 RepID=UPI00244BB5DF|nr:glutamine amidotransferase [Rothia kristinae]WGH08551.1 glutamine amidotransferase [Rothia kristinae]